MLNGKNRWDNVTDKYSQQPTGNVSCIVLWDVGSMFWEIGPINLSSALCCFVCGLAGVIFSSSMPSIFSAINLNNEDPNIKLFIWTLERKERFFRC